MSSWRRSYDSNGQAIDTAVRIGSTKARLHLRPTGVYTPEGYAFFLTNLLPRIGPRQVADVYRKRWELDQLRGWKRQPAVRKQTSRGYLKATT